jgi:ubiquinone/menaquinone biosynthesis C-methylase UbiE
VSFYEKQILPRLLDLSMRHRGLMPYRRRTITAASGVVLEIGIGSGLNLPLYEIDADRIYGIDPSRQLIEFAKKRTRQVDRLVFLARASAEELPFKDGSFDNVVTTWTLCTIPDVLRALGEMQRVLKPDGRLLFVEHGLAPDRGIERWQNWLTPCWKHIGGGCHLNRKMDDLIRAAGFQIDQLQTGYMKGPKPLTFMYQGCARRT